MGFNGVKSMKMAITHIDEAVLLLEIENGARKGNRLANLAFYQKISLVTIFYTENFQKSK